MSEVDNDPEKTLAPTLALFRRGGWAMLEEVDRARKWRRRRVLRRRVGLAALAVLAIAGPVAVALWPR